MLRPHRQTLALSLLVLAALAPLATAQDTKRFTNLQVLDADLEEAQLMGIMRSWTRQLGVRCTHCHVGSEDLEDARFASDEKPAKRTARQMLRMARDINLRHLADLPGADTEGSRRAQHVQCYTCHRGRPTPPRPTEEVLAEAFETGGAAAVVERFEALRREHADDGVYDLRRTPMFRLGRDLLRKGRVDDGKQMTEAMLQLFPDFADGYVLLGRAHLLSGDLDAAAAQIRRARQIEPDNRFSVWLERQIEAQRAPDP